MTSGWLLIVVVVVSCQSVDSQLTTCDEACDDGCDGRVLRELQTVLNRLGKMYKRNKT